MPFVLEKTIPESKQKTRIKRKSAVQQKAVASAKHPLQHQRKREPLDVYVCWQIIVASEPFFLYKSDIASSERKTTREEKQLAKGFEDLPDAKGEFYRACEAMVEVGYMPDSKMLASVPDAWLDDVPDMAMIIRSKRLMDNLVVEYTNRTVGEKDFLTRFEKLLKDVAEGGYSERAAEIAQEYGVKVCMIQARLDVRCQEFAEITERPLGNLPK